ncbi:transcriptional regulator, GntR family with aminotransferase domain protein [Kribbella flavida DSM 17836]|uniref:Transcriptional regulator, GntR family with aminotransferase domain protein n=1 Tax=Kribbella flavida (strain DSM 17836 / JCM 10339 / NBRC 14399) TaxID=479435 RepID=D2PLR9_KRIFD|nr:PLP-dependent aminotransferase family protein [Kribbella flavida]ADB32499.1 transcriptional regulator, GntR family with aminotransferase domain protein [Kribbella flavida DSM 17836]
MDRSGDPAALADLIGRRLSGPPGGLYRRLADALAALIGTAELPVGARLPAERRLAEALAVSRSTVVAAYDELRGRGLVESRRGSGTTVARAASRGRSGADRRMPTGYGESLFHRIAFGPGDVISMTYAVDPGIPELVAEVQDLARTDLPALLQDVGYHPRGILPLRERIADHFEQSGLPTGPDEIVVTSGAHQAIALVTQMYLRSGAAVVIEQPSWPGCFDLFGAAGGRVVGVPLDDAGIRPDLLTAALKEHQPAMLFVMPTFHNPTGRLMSSARRRQVAELAARYGVVVVEDNAYSAGDPSGPEIPPPLAAFAPDHAEVLSIGSVSKAVWGGLRIGWIRAPRPLAERLARHKALADLGSPVIDQALTARLLPRLTEITADRARLATGRRAHIGRLLAERLPEWQWEEPAGGSALWIRLPDTDARVFAQIALRHGVEVVAGHAMDPSGLHDGYLRIPFAYPPEVLVDAVDRLAGAWRELRRHGPAPGVPMV